jgi:hypothetical protein
MYRVSTSLLMIWVLMNLTVVAAQQRAIRPTQKASPTPVRQALIIGNSTYDHTSPLRNPTNDARAISQTLSRLGFEVETLTDVNQRQMEQAINQFGDKLRNRRGVGLFYYAGHGMQVRGENYLLPIDINPRSAADIRYDAVPVGKLLGQMEEAANGMNLVILDACRNNPFNRNFRSTNQGLAQVIAPTGSFISYATAPGEVAADGDGANGLFTERLLKHMVVPGLKLEEVFKRVRVDVQQESNNRQVPWDSSSLTGDFFFVPALPEPKVLSGVDLEDLQSQAESEQQAQSQWIQWQAQMQEDFLKISEFENQDSSIALKLESWRRFLQNWREDNPLSAEDTNLRSKAEARLQYWTEEQVNAQELKQLELELEEQAKQARQRFNQVNNDFSLIAQLLSEGKSSEAGELVSKYVSARQQSQLQSFFASQPAAVQYELAQLYRKGIKVQKDEKMGFSWYEDAAKGNLAKAQTMLGYLYQTGTGTEKNLVLAIEWYQRAADQGEAMAMFNLGNLYRKGNGVSQNEAKARALFSQASARGNKLARQALKRMDQ